MNYRIENIAPILSVQDIARSVKFYEDILGFRNVAWGDDTFTCITRDNTGIYLSKGSQGMPGTWIWIGFDGDINELHQRLIERDVTIKLSPTNFSWAYEMQIVDPDGHVLRFGTDPKDDEPFFDKEM
jgi:catechol 2,3-dioxygenase-like lactoylglutathione lyase family enzyme